MKNSFLLYTAICLALDTDAAIYTISAAKGQNITLDCVSDAVTRLEPPPECIMSKADCAPYRWAVKYLCRDECQMTLYQTNAGISSNKKYLLDYEKKRGVGTLKVTIFRLTSKDAGLYRCGMRAPTDLHINRQFKISVTAMTSPTSASFRPTSRPSSTHSGMSTDKETEADKVVHGDEGQNITIECPLEHLKVPQPPTECFQDKQKCFNYFNPVLYFKKNLEQGSNSIITQQDYAEYERFSLKYGGELLTVGIANLSKADSGRYVCGGQAASGNTASLTFELIVDDAKRNWRLLLLLLIPALLLLMAGGLLVLIRCRKRKSNRDPKRSDTSRDQEVVMYENLPPARQQADSTYESLSVVTRDHNQIYYSLN